jgi:hypothetical protein
MNSERISIAELLGCQALYRSRSLFSVQLLPAQANSVWGKDSSQTKDSWIHYQWRLEALESTDREQVYPVEILKFKNI